MTDAIASSLVPSYGSTDRGNEENRVYSPFRPSSGLIEKDESLGSHRQTVSPHTIGAVPATARGPEKGSKILS